MSHLVYFKNEVIKDKIKQRPKNYLRNLQQTIIKQDDDGCWIDITHPSWSKMHQDHSDQVPLIVDKIKEVQT